MSTLLVSLMVLALFALCGLYIAGRWLEDREPYRSFMRLPLRQKLRFFRELRRSERVPRKVKLIPAGLIAYLAFPIDFIPDFIPVLGYVDDVALVLVALVLMIRLTPRDVIDDLLAEAAGDRG